MAVKGEASREPMRGTGRSTRVGFGLVVLANVALAVAVAIALTWLATRPGLRRRVDLTAAGANTLDPSTRALIERLPDEARVEIDVFFRPLDQPLSSIGAEVQARMYHLLKLAEEERPSAVKVNDHLRGLDATENAEISARMRELGIGELNVVVISSGPRREVLHVLGDIAEIDIGNPVPRQGQYVPPSLVAFRGEEALLKALLRVTQDEARKVYFAWGHGERDLYGEDAWGMTQLQSALRADGFEPARWVPDEAGAVPDDCSVLAVIGPNDPFTEEELADVRAYLERGGRMIAAPGHELAGASSLADLLREYGIELGKGIVCVPVVDPATGRAGQGSQYCAGLILRGTQMAPEHPITKPLVMGDRRVRLFLCNPLTRGAKRPTGGALLDLLASSAGSWEDLPDENGQGDWVHDEQREPIGPFSLAMTSVFPPRGVGPVLGADGNAGERPESRVLVFGAADAFANSIFEFNRDLLLNSFNWASGREHRVNVRTRDPDLRRIDLQGDRSLFLVNLFTTIGLPGLCLALGIFTAWRRRR